jgi:hypothetical protein
MSIRRGSAARIDTPGRPLPFFVKRGATNTSPAASSVSSSR